MGRVESEQQSSERAWKSILMIGRSLRQGFVPCGCKFAMRDLFGDPERPELSAPRSQRYSCECECEF